MGKGGRKERCDEPHPIPFHSIHSRLRIASHPSLSTCLAHRPRGTRTHTRGSNKQSPHAVKSPKRRNCSRCPPRLPASSSRPLLIFQLLANNHSAKTPHPAIQTPSNVRPQRRYVHLTPAPNYESPNPSFTSVHGLSLRPSISSGLNHRVGGRYQLPPPARPCASRACPHARVETAAPRWSVVAFRSSLVGSVRALQLPPQPRLHLASIIRQQ